MQDVTLGHPRRFITNGFILAGLANIVGISIITHGFTNDVFFQVFPGVFSPFGCVAIMLWGLAYIAVAGSYANVRWLCGVFAIEKAAYVATWIWWMVQHASELPQLKEMDLLSGIFFAGYGINDLAFGLFFAWVFIILGRE